MNQTRSCRSRLTPWLLGSVLLGTGAMAAAPDPRQAAQTQYQQARAQCLGGQSHQDQATCLKEAAAALAEARRGTLDDGTMADHQRNARSRCEPLPAEQREACLARMQGQGRTEGSVAGGGIYRELVVPQTSPTAASTPTR
jgi:hypothetical protein